MPYQILCPVCESNWAWPDEGICYECKMAVPDPDEFPLDAEGGSR